MFHKREVPREISFVESHKSRTRGNRHDGHLPYGSPLDIRSHPLLQVSKECVVEKPRDVS
jgi:hypothetical protein